MKITKIYAVVKIHHFDKRKNQVVENYLGLDNAEDKVREIVYEELLELSDSDQDERINDAISAGGGEMGDYNLSIYSSDGWDVYDDEDTDVKLDDEDVDTESLGFTIPPSSYEKTPILTALNKNKEAEDL